MITTNTLRRALLVLILLPLAVPLSGQSKTAVRIIQNSSAGTTVNVIDPATNKVVGVVHGIEINRAIAASVDGSRLFISGQTDSELVVADAKTFEVTKRVKLDGPPDHLSVGLDGRYLFIGLGGSAGAVEVVDTATLQKVKSIPIKGSVHYAYITPDGKYCVTASVGGKTMTVINAQTLEQEWVMTFDNGVRPIAFETGPDGSTKRAFVQITDLHGFAVVDFATHKETARVTLPDIPGKPRNLDGIQGAPAHGIGLTTDGKTMWVLSKFYGYAYAYSMPDLKLVHQLEVGTGPEWMSFTPDGKFMYVAVEGEDMEVVVDLQKTAVVARIPVGYGPKANIMARLQVK
jgi:DNA-binding beta-propeller fold protein YncE